MKTTKDYLYIYNKLLAIYDCEFTSSAYKRFNKLLQVLDTYLNVSSHLSLNECIMQCFTSRSQFYKWIERFICNNYCISSLDSMSTKPNIINYKYNWSIIEEKYKYLQLNPIYKDEHYECWCAINIDLKLNMSYSTFYKHFKNEVEDKREQVKTKHFNQVYEVEEVGYLQVDVKYIPTSICKDGKRLFTYSGIDNNSRYVFSQVYEDKCMANSCDFLSRLNEHYLSKGAKIKEIQTDNGNEFVQNYYKRKGKKAFQRRLSAFEILAHNLNINTKTTKVATAQHNGKIERYQRTMNNKICKKFLLNGTKANKTQLNNYTQQFNHVYNNVRIHRTLNKRPNEVFMNNVHYGVIGDHVYAGTFIR